MGKTRWILPELFLDFKSSCMFLDGQSIWSTGARVSFSLCGMNKNKTNELYFIPITVHRKIGSSSMGAEMRMFWSWVAYRRGRVNLSMCACAYACAYLCACVWALHFTFVWMFFFGECWWVTAIGERMKSQLWLHPSDETYTCVLLYCWTLGCKIHPETRVIYSFFAYIRAVSASFYRPVWYRRPNGLWTCVLPWRRCHCEVL